ASAVPSAVGCGASPADRSATSRHAGGRRDTAQAPDARHRGWGDRARLLSRISTRSECRRGHRMVEGPVDVMGDEPLADDGAARHLTAGAELPDIALPSSRGTAVNLSSRRGAAVVYVYPWTGRPGH